MEQVETVVWLHWCLFPKASVCLSVSTDMGWEGLESISNQYKQISLKATGKSVKLIKCNHINWTHIYYFRPWARFLEQQWPSKEENYSP